MIIYTQRLRVLNQKEKRFFTMTITILVPLTERMYANNGQHLEQIYRFNKSGKICKADNIKGADYEDIQIKSARATICKGTDLKSHIENDVAKRYVYITKSLVAYEMSKSEYLEFTMMFATLTRESSKNGGGEKMRLKSESKAMIEWLRAKA
jgi:hypothetical protein